MNREKTNSITHLVKIVANEAIDERIDQLNYAAENAKTKVISCRDFMESIQSSLEKTGMPWTAEEDQILFNEVRVALAQIAKNHSRSINAIKARIRQESLI